MGVSPLGKTPNPAFRMGAEAKNLVMKDSGDNDDDGKNGSGNTGTGIVTKTRPKTKKPSLYKVLLLNDDYTPMEFVVHILEKFFGNKTARRRSR